MLVILGGTLLIPPLFGFLFPSTIVFDGKGDFFTELLWARARRTSFPESSFFFMLMVFPAISLFSIISFNAVKRININEMVVFKSSFARKSLVRKLKYISGLPVLIAMPIFGIFFGPIDFNFCRGCISTHALIYILVNSIFLLFLGISIILILLVNRIIYNSTGDSNG